MPRKYKRKTSGVSQTINITVNTEKKRKPRKKRASKSVGRRGFGAAAPYTGPSTIYGEPLPLPPRVIEVNAPYLLQQGSTLATGQIPVPVLQNAPQREMIMDAPRSQYAPSIMDDARSQASSRRSYMKPSFKENLTETVRENESIASMEEPPQYDPLDAAVAKEEILPEPRESKSLFSSVVEGAKEYAVPAATELAANALIGTAAAAGQSVGIPFAATFGAGTLAKEAIKGSRSRKKQVKIAREAVEEAIRLTESIPFKVSKRNVSVFEKYFGGDAAATKSALTRIKREHPDATEADLDNYFEGGIPFSR